MNDKEFIKKLNLRNEKRARERKDSPFDPVKLIGDLIQHQRMAIKIQAGKSGGSDG